MAPPDRARTLARAAVVALAGRLPRERGEALVDLARAARSLATGRRGRPVRRGLDGPAAAVARAALAAGDLAGAIARADEALARDPGDAGALDVRRLALARSGELTAAHATLRRLRAIDESPVLALDERILAGRLAETTPGWLPRVPGPVERYDPHPDRVLHLLKESLPALQNGYTLRSRYTLLAQRAAGLDPVVITGLGFPRSTGEADPAPREDVDGIVHHRLDLGPDYDPDGPADLVLRDQAWMTADLIREVRPELLHAGSGRRGYEGALVALALGRKFDVPVVYEVRSFLETTWSVASLESEPAARGGSAAVDGSAALDGLPSNGSPAGPGGAASELSRRRSATEVRAMLAADAVITIAHAMRDDIVGRGIPAERVHVVPNGVDTEAFQPMAKDPALLRTYRLGGRPIVGYVSTLDHPREGHEVLIEAVAALRRRGRNVDCLIVGDGARRPELERLSRRLGVSAAVVFTGRVPHAEVAAHHALIDLFVVPRRDERAARYVTPLKPFEAMAMARPLVVADLPALLELADPDGPAPRGVAFRSGDADALAVAVDALLGQEGRAEAFGRAGRAWVERERTWAANGPRYRAIYDAVRAARSGSRARP